VSHVALRRVMIRLLHDPVFATAVYADAESALAGVDLSATERAWLTAPPPAAWQTDSARPARVLAALAEEFPATVTLAPAHAAGFLRFSDSMQGQCCFPRGFRSVDLNDPAPWQPSNSQSVVKGDGAGGDRPDLNHGIVAQFHNGALAIFFFHLIDDQLERLHLFPVVHVFV